MDLSVDMILLLLGGIIVVGFLGNIQFRITKVPSVIMLMILGVVLGPSVLGLVTAETVQNVIVEQVAPPFGMLALLIILFEGGLDLELKTVVREAGKSIFLSVLIFALTLVLTTLACVYLIELDLMLSLMIGGIVGGTSPAIIIPVVSKLRVSDRVKTMMNLEPALADVLIIISVIVFIDIWVAQSGSSGEDAISWFNIAVKVFGQFAIGVGAAIVAGVVWARFMGSLRGESLSYMLTLGFIFLLNSVVHFIDGSGPIAILTFGIVLANVGDMAKNLDLSIRKLLGINVDPKMFKMDSFVHHITVEISFLVRTFFFVLLGLMFDFSALTWDIALHIGIIVAACLIARYLGSVLFFKIDNTFNIAERLVVIGMVPRGLATAVVALAPLQAGVPGSDVFPLYALGVIGATSIFMSAMVVAAERKVSRAEDPADVSTNTEEQQKVESETSQLDEPSYEQQSNSEEAAKDSSDNLEVPMPAFAGSPDPETYFDDYDLEEPEEELTFADRLLRWMKIPHKQFKELDYISTRSSRLTNVLYWIRVVSMSFIAVLGMMMEDMVILLVAMLFSPVLSMMNTISFSLTTGDIYIFLKSMLKLVITSVVIIMIGLLTAAVVPFSGIPSAIELYTQATILNFVLGLIVGVLVPIVLLRGKMMEIFAVSPLVAMLIFPGLATIGYILGVGDRISGVDDLILGSALLATSNLTAMLISSTLTLMAFGLTKHEASDFIQAWKQKEFNHNFLRSLLKFAFVRRLLNTTGTVRTRLITIVMIGVILVYPLSTTIEEVRTQYVQLSVIQEMASAFEIEGRSQLENVTVEGDKNGVKARMRLIIEGDYFTNQERVDFEREAERTLGVPVELKLVQTVGSIGAGTNPSSVRSSQEIQSFDQRISELQFDYQTAVSSLPDIPGKVFLRVETEFVLGSGKTKFYLDYLAEEPIKDAEVIVRQLLSDHLKVSVDNVHLRWISNTFSANTDAFVAAEVSELTNGIVPLSELFESSVGLQGRIFLPALADTIVLDSARSKLFELYPKLSNADNFEIVDTSLVDTPISVEILPAQANRNAILQRR